MKAQSFSTAPGSSTTSGFATSTSSPDVAATPALTLAAKLTARAFRSNAGVERIDRLRPGEVRDHEHLVDLRSERR